MTVTINCIFTVNSINGPIMQSASYTHNDVRNVEPIFCDGELVGLRLVYHSYDVKDLTPRGFCSFHIKDAK